MASCAHNIDTNDAPPIVKIEELVSAPQRYDGKRIRIEGWAVRSSEDYNLYPNRSAACSDGDEVIAVGAEWDDTHLRYRSMRRGVFDATFSHKLGLVQQDGAILVSTAMSLGPLEDIVVVRWTSAARPPCR